MAHRAPDHICPEPGNHLPQGLHDQFVDGRANNSTSESDDDSNSAGSGFEYPDWCSSSATSGEETGDPASDMFASSVSAFSTQHGYCNNSGDEAGCLGWDQDDYSDWSDTSMDSPFSGE